MRSLTDHGRARNGTLLEARDAGPGSTRRSGGDRAGERGGTVGPGHVGLMERLEAVAAEVAAEWSGRTAGQGVISGDELVRMRRVVNRLEAAFTGATRLFDRSQEWSAEGAVSAAAWLRGHCRLSPPESHQRVKVGRALERMPATRVAFESGEISYSHARVLAGPVDEQNEEAFRGVEEVLVGVARECSPSELRRVVEHWRMNLDGDRGAGAANDRYERRRLHVSRTFWGMVAVDGLLDPEGGEILLTALQGLIDAGRDAQGDPRRSMPQRRADALVEACRSVLDGRVPVTRGGERPHISVVVSLEALSSITLGSFDPISCAGGPRCDAAHLGPVSPETALRWACDAGISRVITGARGEPLEVGRQRRTVTGAQRRAIVVRDCGCRFPGCDRPPAWCVPHHLRHWADGGPTDLDNLLLLCHRHHRMVHEGQWGIELDGEGGVRVRAPAERARGPGAGVAA